FASNPATAPLELTTAVSRPPTVLTVGDDHEAAKGPSAFHRSFPVPASTASRYAPRSWATRTRMASPAATGELPSPCMLANGPGPFPGDRRHRSLPPWSSANRSPLSYRANTRSAVTTGVGAPLLT